MLHIIADPVNETLEFRRQRVLNRLSMSPPFTTIFLRQRLDEILGVGQYVMLFGSDGVGPGEVIPPFTVIVESAVNNFQWYEELAITIGKIKPANIVYITRPLIANALVNGEVLQYSEMGWNYRLNGSWNLGEKPFASLTEKGVIKMATTQSLKKALFETMGDAAMGAVNKVVLNGTYEITSFTMFEISTLDDNQCVLTIRYTVPVTSGLGNITRVEVVNSDSQLLSQSNVYVPLIQDIELKHTLTIKEGI